MTTVAIIQARSGSRRLPEKIFADLAGRSMLEHVIRRVRMAQTLDVVAVATTTSGADDRVDQLCRELSVPCSRGSEDDVLSRYFDAARSLGAELIVRITADCPFIDPSVIDRIVIAFRSGGCDYASNTIVPTYPDGLDVEVFSFHALERAFHDARLLSEREHVTPFIKKHPELFRLVNVTHDHDLSAMRWTVDEPADLEFAQRVYETMNEGAVGFQDLVKLVEANRDLLTINAGIERDAGYAKSLEHDGVVHTKEGA